MICCWTFSSHGTHGSQTNATGSCLPSKSLPTSDTSSLIFADDKIPKQVKKTKQTNRKKPSLESD